MELEEIFSSPFLSPTTCYSAKQRRYDGDIPSIQIATETHILGVDVDVVPSEKDFKLDVRCTSRQVPRDSSTLACVGYSLLEERERFHRQEDDNDDEKNKSATERFTTIHEAMVLIDPSFLEEDILIQDQEFESISLHQPSYAFGDKDDNASVISNTDTSISTSNRGSLVQSQQPPPTPKTHRRGSSVVSVGTPASIAGTASTAASTAITGSPHHQKTKSELSTGSSANSSSDRDIQPASSTGAGTGAQGVSGNHHNRNPSMGSINMSGTSDILDSSNTQLIPTTDDKKKTKAALLLKSKARLILLQQKQEKQHQRRVSSCSPDKGDADDWQQQQPIVERTGLHSLALLDFRPLCPCVAKWGASDKSSNNGMEPDGNEIVGVFVGSADDAVLRFYVTSSTDPQSLVPVVLPEEHFSVDTPVMALDFCSVRWPKRQGDGKSRQNTTYTLALACQDGTMQLITWEGCYDDNMFANITSEKVIVDGPLVSIKLEYHPDASLRLIAGSLCGYVCQLSYDWGYKSSWEGPFMVVQDLWNSLLDAEDSVLALDVRDNYLAVGTQVGRCVLYATRDSENYFPVWYTLLPYSVHGIMIMKNGDEAAENEPHEKMLESNCCINLAVTTRRSFHMFQGLRGKIAWERKPSRQRYSSVSAKGRLTQTLREVRKENQEQEARMKAAVSETIENILDRVEETVQMHVENPASEQELDEATVVVSSAIDDLLDRVDHELSSIGEDRAGSTGMEAIAPKPPQLEYSSSEDENEGAPLSEDLQVLSTDETPGTGSDEEVSTVSVPVAPSQDEAAVDNISSATSSSEDCVLLEPEPEN